MTAEAEAKAAREAREPSIVRGLVLAATVVHFLLALPAVLVTGRFRGQRVHPLTYCAALALLVSGCALGLQHLEHHGHTYCEVYLSPEMSSRLCAEAPRLLYSDGAGVTVTESKGLRSLYFEGHVQTRLRTRDGRPVGPHYEAVVDEVVNNHYRGAAARVVVLGSGGGGVASELIRRCERCTVVGVESRRGVIDVAERFFQPSRPPQLTYVQADARQYLKTQIKLGEADAIVNMAFQALFERSGDGRSAAVLPNHALNAALPDLVHSRLRPGGIYVVTIRCPRVGPHATPLLDLMKRLERRFRLVSVRSFEEVLPFLPQHHVVAALK